MPPSKPSKNLLQPRDSQAWPPELVRIRQGVRRTCNGCNLPAQILSRNHFIMRLAAGPQASLMACMETQTAADAPIEGAFRGAFTDHFCQVLQGQFEQVPQHEGRDLHAPLFGQAGEIANGSDRAPAVQGSCGDPAAELPAGAEAEAEALTAQQRVYRAQIKFLDTMDGAAGRLPAGAGPAGDRPGAGDRAWHRQPPRRLFQ